MMESSESEASPYKIKEMKQSKKEIESKVGKMLKLIKTNGQEKKGKFTEKKRLELIGLIEDFHKQYQSLHSQYGYLKEEIGKKPYAKATSSSSSSDSEYYSSEEVTQSPRRSRGEAGSSRTPRKRREHEASLKIEGELEDQFNTMKAKLESLQGAKKDLEAQIENKAAEAKQFEEKTTKLQARLSELESILKQKGDGMCTMQKEQKDNEKQFEEKNRTLQARISELEAILEQKGDEISTMLKEQKENENVKSRIQDLEGQVSDQQRDFDAFHAEKDKVNERKQKEVSDQVNVLRQELDSVHNHNSELEFQLDLKSKTIAENLIQIDSLCEEIQRKTTAADTLQNEKEGFHVQNKDLESKVQFLSNEINKLEELIRSKNQEADQLGDNNAILNGRVSELERMLANRGDKTSTVQKMSDGKHEEASAEVDSLWEEIQRKATTEKTLQNDRKGFHVQKGLESKERFLSEEINKLEEMIRSKNQEVDQLQDKNEFLNGKVSEFERILANRRDGISTFQEMNDRKQNELSAEIMALNAQIKRLQQELNSLTSEKSKLEKQNEKLTQVFGQSQDQANEKIQSLTTNIVNQQRILTEQQDTVKKLMEEHRPIRHVSLDSPTKNRVLDSSRLNLHSVERKVEELSEKFHQTMENHFRILNQRILVAEQIQQETIDGCKKAKEGFELENKELIETMGMCEHEIREIVDEILEHGNLRTRLDSAAWKLDDDHRNFLSRISRLLNEIKITRNWVVEINDEIGKLKHNVEGLKMQLEAKDKKEMLLTEKVRKLEEKLSKEGGDKLDTVSQLERTVGNLVHQVKEKDEVLRALAEEKREAIRQLCFLIDYHRSRHDQLREEISKSSVRVIRKT